MYIHADETVLQVLKEPGKKPQSNSYMWLYRTSGDTQSPIVLYEYQPDRAGKRPKDFLEGFKGYLHTDGYSAYHNLSKPSLEDFLVWLKSSDALLKSALLKQQKKMG